MQKQNWISCLSNGVSSSVLKLFCLVVRMFSSKSFIKAFRHFSTKVNVDGLCFSHHYKFSKSVVILCLTLTVCLGEEVKSVNGCKGNYMFNESMKKCIECPHGYIGPGCIRRCPATKYGRFCLSNCTCPAEQCNAITGCSAGTTTNDRVESQNELTTLSTEFTQKNRFTSNILPNSSSSPMGRKTVENKHRTSLLIAVAGTCISTLLLVAIGFQLRARMILCRREHNDQQHMFCENGNVYAEANNVK